MTQSKLREFGELRLPDAPHSIQKGSTLNDLLDQCAIECLSHNISVVYPSLNRDAFCHSAIEGIAPLGIIQRGHHLAKVLRDHLPKRYADAVKILVRSLTPPLNQTDSLGLGVFF